MSMTSHAGKQGNLPDMQSDQEIKFTQEEWVRANDIAVRLLEALGPRPSGSCPTCNPPSFLLPNYRMKYELAKALRENPAPTPG